MPVIREYTGDAGIRPSQGGVDATAASARRVQGSYNEGASALNAAGEAISQAGGAMAATGRRFAGAIADVGNVAVKAIEHQEVSRGSKSFAEMQANATQAWNEQVKNADPNDPTVGQRFLQGFEKDLEEAGKGFLTEGGQRFAQSQIISFRNHFTNKVMADQSAMASQAIAVNLDQTKNALSVTVNADPTALDESLRMFEGTVGKLVETSPNLPAAVAARVRGELLQDGKEQIVKAALVGLAKISPSAATKAIESGRYKDFVDATTAKAIVANAKQQERAERVDANYRKALEKEERSKISEAAESEYLKVIYGDDDANRNKLSAKGIVNDDRLENKTKEKLIRTLEAETAPEPLSKISQPNTANLLERLRSTDDADRITSTDPIYAAYTNREITKADFNFLIKQYNDMQTPDGQRLSLTKREFFRAVGPKIDKSNPLMGVMDQDGKLNRYRLEQDVNARIEEFRRAGKSPYLLFDPNSPDYMGADAALRPYQKSLSDSVRDTTRRMQPRPAAGPSASFDQRFGTTSAPAPVARKPNESAADYLKRIGKQ